MIFSSLARRLCCVEVKPNTQWLVYQPSVALDITTPRNYQTRPITTTSLLSATYRGCSTSPSQRPHRDCNHRSEAGFCATSSLHPCFDPALPSVQTKRVDMPPLTCSLHRSRIRQVEQRDCLLLSSSASAVIAQCGPSSAACIVHAVITAY
jgi:hypothetical protein